MQQGSSSMALLKGDHGFSTIGSLDGLREAGGTRAPHIYPSTYFACTIDCAWYLELHPLGPACPHAVDSRRPLPEGPAGVARLRRGHGGLLQARWDITNEENIVASDRQQKDFDSPFCRPWRYSYREPLVHEIDNWILDRVLGNA